MLDFREEEKKEYDKKEREKLDQELLTKLDELGKKTSRIKVFSEERDIKSLIAALIEQPAQWSIFILGELQEENSKLVSNEILDQEQLKIKDNKNEIEKLLTVFDPRAMPTPEVGIEVKCAPQSEPKVPLNIAQVSDLKDFVGGLLIKEAVKGDEELKNQVLNLYYRLDYMQQIITDGIEKALKQNAEALGGNLDPNSKELSDKADPAKIGSSYSVAS